MPEASVTAAAAEARRRTEYERRYMVNPYLVVATQCDRILTLLQVSAPCRHVWARSAKGVNFFALWATWRTLVWSEQMSRSVT